MIQTADGAMAEMSSILHRGAELCVQAANDVLNEEDRDSIQAELDLLREEIDRVSDKTIYNNRYLLRDDNSDVVGEADPPVISGSLPSWVSIDSASASAGYMADTFTTEDGVSHSAATIDFSAFDNSKIAESLNTGLYTTCCTCDNYYSLEFTDETTSSCERSGSHYIYKIGIGDAQTGEDVVKKIIDATNGQPNGHYTRMDADGSKLIIYDERDITNISANENAGLIGEGVARTAVEDPSLKVGDLYLQIGANAGEDLKISLPAMSASKLGIIGVKVNNHAAASSGIAFYQNALEIVNSERSKLGAMQNRLEHTVNQVGNYKENLEAAESRIRDTNIESEMIKYAKTNILKQVGESLQAQVKQESESVLQLLG